jgi:hypothetical protein
MYNTMNMHKYQQTAVIRNLIETFEGRNRLRLLFNYAVSNSASIRRWMSGW